MSENIRPATVEGIDFDEIFAALETASPTKKTIRKEAFTRLLPTIESAISRNVPHRQILDILAQNGLKLSAATFKKLLNDARGNQHDERA